MSSRMAIKYFGSPEGARTSDTVRSIHITEPALRKYRFSIEYLEISPV
jgi:hypothetical protein